MPDEKGNIKGIALNKVPAWLEELWAQRDKEKHGDQTIVGRDARKGRQ